MIVKEKHYVTFVSPGTLFAETFTQKIKDWNIATAVEMAKTIFARHGARPYAFYFTSRKMKAGEPESKEAKRSPFYYLGGKVETAAEVLARNDPDEEILRANIEGNGFKRVLVNTNSYKAVLPLNDNDVVLEFDGYT
jgi:hypothetical protein